MVGGGPDVAAKRASFLQITVSPSLNWIFIKNQLEAS